MIVKLQLRLHSPLDVYSIKISSLSSNLFWLFYSLLIDIPFDVAPLFWMYRITRPVENNRVHQNARAE